MLQQPNVLKQYVQVGRKHGVQFLCMESVDGAYTGGCFGMPLDGSSAMDSAARMALGRRGGAGGRGVSDPLAYGFESRAVGGACVHVGGGAHERILPRDVHERGAVCAVWACRVRAVRPLGCGCRTRTVVEHRNMAVFCGNRAGAGDGRALQHARRGGRNAAGLGKPSVDEKMSGSARKTIQNV